MKTLTKIQAIITFIAVGLVFALGVVFAFVPMQFGSKDYESFLRAIPVSQELANGVSAVYEVTTEDVSQEQMDEVVDKISNIVEKSGYKNVYVSQVGEKNIRVDIRESLLAQTNSETIESLKAITSGQLVLSTGSKFETESTETAPVWKINGWEHIDSVEVIQSQGVYGVQINLNKEGKEIYETAYNQSFGSASFYMYVGGTAWPNTSYNKVDASQSVASTGSLTWSVGTKDVADYYYDTFVAGMLPVTLNSTVETFYVLNTNLVVYLVIALGVLFVALSVVMILKRRMLGVFSVATSLLSVIFTMFIMQAMPWVEVGVATIVLAFILVMLTFFVNNVVIANINQEFVFGKSIETSVADGYSKSTSLVVDLAVLLAIFGIVFAFAGTGELVAIGSLAIAFAVVNTLLVLFVNKLLISALIALKPDCEKLCALTKKGEDK